MDAHFTPILYLKAGCPHCFKLRLFVLEAGLSGAFVERELTPGDAQEQAIRDTLAPHFARVTFPTAEVAPGVYRSESDDIIALYAGEHGIDTAALPLLRTFADMILPKYRAVRQENKDLLARLAAATA